MTSFNLGGVEPYTEERWRHALIDGLIWILLIVCAPFTVYGIFTNPASIWAPVLGLNALLLTLGVMRNLPLQSRAWSFVLILFLFGTLLTYNFGVFSDGRMYLSLPVILAGLLLGRNAGITLLMATSLLIAFLGWSELAGFPDLRASAAELSTENLRWVLFLGNYMTSTGLALAAVLYVIHKLQRSLEKLDHRSTESLAAQNEAINNARHFRLLVENSSDVIWSMDLDMNFTYISPAVFNLRGYTPEEAIHLGMDNFVTSSTAEAIKELFESSLDEDEGGPTETPIRIETSLRHKDGSVIEVEVLVRFLRDATGTPTGVVGTTRDITERRRLEVAMASLLRETQKMQGVEFFDSLTENLSSVLKVKCAMIGELQEDQTVATKSVWMEGSLADNFSYELAGSPCANVVKQEICTYPQEVQAQFPEDILLSEMGIESYSGAPLVNANGDCIGVLACMDDKPMTQLQQNEDLLRIFAAHATAELSRQQAEKERERVGDQLLQSQKLESIGQLAGGIAHDFNNLLVVIQGYLGLAKDISTENSVLAGYHEQIQAASERAASLTQKLLSFSRRQVMQTRPLNLNDIVEEAGKLLKRLLPENIAYETILGAELGTIEADAGQLEQAIVNLAVNAKDAMPEGGRFTIETENILIDPNFVESHPWASVGRYVLLRVSDTGVGIPAEIQDRVFEPFFTTKSEDEGSGLGLSVYFGIIKQHGGFTQLYSELGKGTEFRAYLPIVERTASSLEKKLAANITGGTETLLLVEDDRQVRNLANIILSRAGYTVLSAEDGELAIEQFKQHADRISLVLLDVILPKVGGREVMEEINKLNPEIPILFTSGYSSDAIHTNFILEDDLVLLSKPYSSENLLRKVREMLD